TTIGSGPADPTNNTTPAFGFSSTEPNSTFECKVDSGSFAGCSSGFITPPLGEGLHTFSVRATDPAGNTDATPATQTFTVDTTPPDTTLTPITSPTNNPKPSFAFTGTGTSFECRMDGGTYTGCTSPFVPANNLGDGQHTFDVRAKDAATNVDA